MISDELRGVVVVRFADTPTLVSPAGTAILGEAFGWLVRDAAGIKALVAPDPAMADVGVQSVHLETGDRQDVILSQAGRVRYAQPSAEVWSVAAHIGSEESCDVHVVTSDGTDTAIALREGACLLPGMVPLEGDNPGQLNHGRVPACLHRGSGLVVDWGLTFDVFEADGSEVTQFQVPEARSGLLPVRPRLGAVSRFGLTVEGLFGTYDDSTPFDWFEIALSRR